MNHPGEDAMVIYLELRPRKLSRQCTVYIYLMYLYIYIVWVERCCIPRVKNVLYHMIYLYIVYNIFQYILCIMDIQLMFIISCVYVNIYIYVHA